jgi:hypothetical protein
MGRRLVRGEGVLTRIGFDRRVQEPGETTAFWIRFAVEAVVDAEERDVDEGQVVATPGRLTSVRTISSSRDPCLNAKAPLGSY